MAPSTPYLTLDLPRFEANLDLARRRLAGTGVTLRPHMKTGKCIAVARAVFGGGVGPITVSTLSEAEHFAAAGFDDILYAVGIAPAVARTRAAALE